jgi:pyrroloquinoline-quinone synthase
MKVLKLDSCLPKGGPHVELSEYWTKVDQEVAKFDLLQHPFYQAWTEGRLTVADLKFYAEQYYHQVAAFPTYLTALHARLPDAAMRREVLENAWEEECAECPHSELWIRFLEGMGGSREDLKREASIREVNDLVTSFRALAREAPIASVFGALYAYESQVPRIAAEKLNGLRSHYGADDRTCSYFRLHREADVRHANVWRRILSRLGEQDECPAEQSLTGVRRAARALWAALDGIDGHRRCMAG